MSALAYTLLLYQYNNTSLHLRHAFEKTNREKNPKTLVHN
jgi:hypothetical protein